MTTTKSRFYKPTKAIPSLIPNKGDLKLQMGYGDIEVAKPKKESVKITCGADLKYPMSGYISENSPLIPIFKTAEENQTPLLVRIEQRRKKDVDPNTSIIELTSDQETALKNTFKVLVGVYDVNNEKWVLSKDAQTNPDNDPDDAKEFVRRALNGIEDDIDIDAFFQKKQSLVVDSSVEEKLQLIEFLLLVENIENKQNINFNNKKEIASLFLRMTNNLQRLLTNSDVTDYTHKSYDLAKKIVLNIEKRLPFYLDANGNHTEWFKQAFAQAKGFIELAS